MSNTITTAAKSMWKLLTNAVETNTNKQELNINRPIKGTPFTLAGNQELGYFLAIGKYRITEHKQHPDEALQMLETEPWEIVSRMVAAYIDFEKKLQVTKTEEDQKIESN